MKKNVIGGMVLTCIGDEGVFHFKRSKKNNSIVDRAVVSFLKNESLSHVIKPFIPLGSDERRYNSPGINIPVGVFMRTPYGEYPEYHTSGDNKTIISFKSIVDTISVLRNICGLLEYNKIYYNETPNCEPMLGKRGLYPSKVSNKEKDDQLKAIMWILNLSDGQTDFISVYEVAGLPLQEMINALDLLLKKRLITIQKEQ